MSGRQLSFQLASCREIRVHTHYLVYSQALCALGRFGIVQKKQEEEAETVLDSQKKELGIPTKKLNSRVD